ncbi:MAG: hypothetical protein H8E71_00340 [Candidatus Marinimicrobia bacterium]|nr:hypothetical protein [Candidatus Neomarinimicrobiota bacterium]
MNKEKKLEVLKKIMIDDLLEIEERIRDYDMEEVDEDEYDVCRVELNGYVDQKEIYEKVLVIID